MPEGSCGVRVPLDCLHGPKDAATVKRIKTTQNMRKLKSAQKHIARALANTERAVNLLEESGFAPQAYTLDEAGESMEELSETLAAL